MARECEAKIKVPDLTPLRRRLGELGAVSEGACLERNWVFDRHDDELRRQGILLRVRSMGGVGGVLTVKHRVEGGAFKTREEVESMVDSTEDLLRQLEMLGFRVTWIYEKYRATWLWNDCIIALDECPEIGCFIEIEGAAESIVQVAGHLGLDPNDHIDDNYLGLWRNFLAARGETPRHMVFSRDEAKQRSRQSAITTRILPEYNKENQ